MTPTPECAMDAPARGLPDGSGCFTATIMSEEEAMRLPLKERPICHRISPEMYHAVFEAIGEASMCWEPGTGDAVFVSEKASDVATRLCFKIAEEIEKNGKPSAADARKSESTLTFWGRFKLRFTNPRAYWEIRAKTVNENANQWNGWSVDSHGSWSPHSERYTWRAHPPDYQGEPVLFDSSVSETGALKKAVKYAEMMNDPYFQ